ncbi:hypothetical protein [Rhodococcoides yunnanense]|uniref:hypothetical protein n=1 Tax=Rhodococcoides yunnanense TaxID=278209 RepID=UPI0009333136|nr:hypothetical protein [Rhodococcus yunnanensis]
MADEPSAELVEGPSVAVPATKTEIIMAAKTTTDNDIADDDIEPLADETASQAQRVVAAYATDADECRMLLAMLGIQPTAKVD